MALYYRTHVHELTINMLAVGKFEHQILAPAGEMLEMESTTNSNKFKLLTNVESFQTIDPGGIRSKVHTEVATANQSGLVW